MTNWKDCSDSEKIERLEKAIFWIGSQIRIESEEYKDDIMEKLCEITGQKFVR